MTSRRTETVDTTSSSDALGGGDLAALAAAIAGAVDADVRAVTIERSRYSTSHPIDNIDVVLSDSSVIRLVRKDLAPRALLPQARHVKPRFTHDRHREPRVYVDILASAGLGTPSCFGVIDEHGAPRWLLLERVDLVELFQVGDLHRWESAARWAARLHRQFAGQADALVESAVPLLRHDRDWVDRWAARATSYAPTRDARVARLLALGPGLAEAYAGLPRTFVHGELYASNVLVGDAGTSRVCAVDWEMAAIAPGLVDLAALTAGRWSADARHKLEDAYCDELGRPRDAEFVEALQVCRLTACLQWLGWAQGWRAPTEHAHPWLDEAMELADLLGW